MLWRFTISALVGWILVVIQIDGLPRGDVLGSIHGLIVLLSSLLCSWLLNHALSPALEVMGTSSICGCSFSGWLVSFSPHRILRPEVFLRGLLGIRRPWPTFLWLSIWFSVSFEVIHNYPILRLSWLVRGIRINLVPFLVSILASKVVVGGWSIGSMLLINTIVSIISALIHLLELSHGVIPGSSSLVMVLAILRIWRVKLVHLMV